MSRERERIEENIQSSNEYDDANSSNNDGSSRAGAAAMAGAGTHEIMDSNNMESELGQPVHRSSLPGFEVEAHLVDDQVNSGVTQEELERIKAEARAQVGEVGEAIVVDTTSNGDSQKIRKWIMSGCYAAVLLLIIGLVTGLLASSTPADPTLPPPQAVDPTFSPTGPRTLPPKQLIRRLYPWVQERCHLRQLIRLLYPVWYPLQDLSITVSVLRLIQSSLTMHCLETWNFL
jgi:hypothetical protein